MCVWVGKCQQANVQIASCYVYITICTQKLSTSQFIIIPLRPLQQHMQPHKTKITPAQVQFLRPLDQLMKVYSQTEKVHSQTDKVYFCQLFDRKRQLIQELMSTGIDHEKYFALVAKVLKAQTTQKEFARMDLLLLRDKHQMNKQAWFEQLVGETQMALTQQQAKYNQYQSQMQQHHPKPQPPVQNSPPTSTPNINITEFTNLKLLDQFMGKYYETPYRQTFIQLYQKKQRILQALQTGKLKNDHYLMIAQKIFHQTKSDQVRKAMKCDLEMLVDLHDNNAAEWVKQAVKESKDEIEVQKQTYELHKQGVQVKKRQKKVQIDLQAYMHIPIPPNTDPSQCISFPLIDRYMKQSKSNPQLYMTLYQKKQKLLWQCEDGKLTQKTYQEYIRRMINGATSEDLKEIYQQELDDIKKVHEGNAKQWFENVVDETKVQLMIQEDVYAVMKKEFKNVQKPVEKKVVEQMPQPQKAQLKPQPNKGQPKTAEKQSPQKHLNIDPDLGYNPTTMFSLKVLQNGIIAHQSNPQLFTKLFAQKRKIITMMGNQQLDAAKYKAIQEKLMKEFDKNEQVKDQIQFDLNAIDDFHDGNVEAWFVEVVENAGLAYDSQLEKYESSESKSLNKGEQMNQRIESSGSQQQAVQVEQKQGTKKGKVSQTDQHKQKKQQKPQAKQSTSNPKAQPLKQPQTPTPFNIPNMYSLKVLDHTLTQHKENQRLYMFLFAQKQAIIKKMQEQQIDAQKYKQLQQKVMKDYGDNDDVRDMVEFDLADIDDLYDGEVAKWFEEVVNDAGVEYENQLQCYLKLQEKYTVKQSTVTANTISSTVSIHTQQYESPEKQLESKLSEASNQINHSTPKSKIRFYLHEMAVWESLAKYYKKNNLDPNSNTLLKIYFNVSRHQVQEIIDKIKTEPAYDIVSYCKKFFPPITEAVFYQGVQNFEERVEHGVKACNKAVQQLKDYTKNLRKGLNTKNFENVKDKISEYQENIKYLTNLPALIRKNNKLIPLPKIQQIPVSYPNMDEQIHLEPNEIQLKLIKIQGIKDEQLIKIYFNGQCRHESKVKSGPSAIVIKGQQSAENFPKALRGDHKSFSISMYTEGWFSKTKQGLENLNMAFLSANIHEDKVTVGKATIFYECRVRVAKKQILTEIKEIKIVKYPAYEHSKQVEEDLIAQQTTASKA